MNKLMGDVSQEILQLHLNYRGSFFIMYFSTNETTNKSLVNEDLSIFMRHNYKTHIQHQHFYHR